MTTQPPSDAPKGEHPPVTPAKKTSTRAAAGTGRKKAAAAGPAGKVKSQRVSSGLLEQSLAVILASLDDDKAENIVTIDLTGRASFADKMVVATGLADRQIAAMAQHIERKLKEIGLKRMIVEGANGSDWVLLDTGDIIVHLFKPESRELYGLEKMWGAEFDDEVAQPVAGA
ncbi:ribosome silencing factor [Acetobacter thailandicus]|uniref:ribosome silencing factor n=1 Tax=Acetobacter thailandicus TaxID=1502842 RepID=UPI001BABA397|nr:ribosome silencing factor [Acetobacter thailandicus]